MQENLSSIANTKYDTENIYVVIKESRIETE